MKLIVGLGNPGRGYAETRHNVGRRLTETLAARQKVPFSKQRSLKASLAELRWEKPVTAAYPETFVNLSGEVLARLIQHWGLDPARDLLIVVDDTALPLGRLRLRSRGSDGGHNGLKSIQTALGSSHYARLRIGVGTPEGEADKGATSLEAYVLSPFLPSEAAILKNVLEKGIEACKLWVQGPVEAAMNIINSRVH